ncbi:AMP-binding protein [Alkalilimnicola ehrlichii MLHE-1]|uniref:Long-chain-fatty-acid--CoA ligase n=1 Tax=Alkalilimnicola ehrlichii (strain ATCC BAA-1101 / DSM 17681 / MLHE-1) TaxID=187272 RepID=Q0A5Q7_ALKEH|nr:AMP-binding protein [Alkalilimnicola ehrlichii]ABI57830.1 AMP-dependent synthetase and ligase [Alkalilimnicola ehrlichii MLHE-1]
MATSQHSAQAFYDGLPWQHHYGEGVSTEFQPLPESSLAEMLRQAAHHHPERTAFTTCLDNGLNASLDYATTDRLSDHFMAWLLREAGLGPGEPVAIQMPNCLAYPVTAFGALKAGTPLVNMNPLYTAPEMHHQLADSGARVLVIVDLFADKLEQALNDTAVEHVVLTSVADFFPKPLRWLIQGVLRWRGERPPPPAGVHHLGRTLEEGAAHLGQFTPPSPAADDLALLQYTGGTTGRAKGAMLRHRHLLANVAQIEAVAGPALRGHQDTVLTALPLYHIFAFTFNLLVFHRQGSHNVLCPSPRPVDRLRKAFARYPVTKFSGVNLLLHGLCQAEWFRSQPPPQLDLTVAGGTALNPRVAERWSEVTRSRVLEGYGLTETAPVVAVNPPQGEARLGTVGLPVPGTEVRIVDDNDRPVPAGERGEVVVRGPQVFDGYWKQPQESEHALRGGWFHTGDVGVMDEQGYLRIVDRKKDMIDVGGFNVFPQEVEEALLEHPAIIMAAVVGVPAGGDAGDEQVVAYVVCDERESAPDEDALRQFLNRHLTRYKIPRRILFRDSLPVTTVGKVLRRELREQAREEVGPA